MERDAKDKSIDTSGSNVDKVVVSEGEAIVIDGKKKKRSPTTAVLVEGSRCSRVNGRGWRCNQQTLIGYSLCEHHLGKGRLRSISSVRRGGRKQPKVSNAREPRKIGERVGLVKARSMSSLLGEAAAGPSVDSVAAAGGDMPLV